jgi:hypothetical protein
MLSSIPPQLEVQIRSLFTALAVGAATKGWIQSSDAELYIGIAMAVIAIAWNYYVNRAPQLAAALRSSEPNTVVVSTPAVAAATPNDSKIVSSAAPKAVIEAAVADMKQQEEVKK